MRAISYKRLITSLVTLLAFSTPLLGEARTAGQDDSVEIKLTNPKVKSGLELHVSGRKIIIAPGEIEIDKKVIQVQHPTMVQVPIPGKLLVSEQPLTFKAPDDKDKPTTLILPNCRAAQGDATILRKVLVPGSLKLKGTKGERASEFKEGTDYTLDIITGTITLPAASTIKPDETVFADYACWRRRLDTIAINQAGELLLVQGIPARSAPEPANLEEGMVPLANIYSDWGEAALKPIDILPIATTFPTTQTRELWQRNRTALAPIINKLRAGKPVKIAFWGDGVCMGMDARSRQSAFAVAVLARLKKLFPQAQLTAANCTAPTGTSSVRIAAVDTEVLQLKPDLIIIAFISDLSVPAGALEDNYGLLRSKVEKTGTRLLVCTPHFPAPRFARASTWQTIADKAYYTVLRDMSVNTDYVAVAEVGNRWENLRKEGLRPDIMLVNELMYPNNKGHAIYTEEIIKAFGFNPIDGQQLPPPEPPKAVEPEFANEEDAHAAERPVDSTKDKPGKTSDQ